MTMKRWMLCMLVSVAMAVTLIPSLSFAAVEPDDWWITAVEDEYDLQGQKTTRIEVELYADDEDGNNITESVRKYISYQWYRDIDDVQRTINGATGATFNTGALTAPTNFACRVRDKYNTEKFVIKYHMMMRNNI